MAKNIAIIAIFNDMLEGVEINGFVTMTEKESKDFEDLAESITWDFTYPIGDEILEYSSGEDLLSRIDFKEVSTEELNLLTRIFNGSFGIFINGGFLENIINNEGW